MAAAFEKDIFAEGEAANSISCVFGSNVTAGNLLVLGTAIYDPGQANVTPTGGGTWSTTTAPTWQSSGNALICHCANATGGATTVTYNCTDGSYLGVNVAEFSGMETSSVLDVQTSTTNAGSTTPSTGSTGTTAQNDELVVALLCIPSAPVSGGFGIDAATTGYTNIHLNQRATGELDANGISMDYKVVSTTGTQSAAWGTLSSSQPWIGKICTFKAAAGGGATTPKGPLGNPFFGPFGGPI